MVITIVRDLPEVVSMVYNRLKAVKPESYLRMWRHSYLALFRYLMLQPI